MSRALQIAAGVLLAAIGLIMIFSPLEVAAALHRPPHSTSEMINLRATWGGTVLGSGLLVAWLAHLRPWRRSILGLLMWLMTGVGLARGTGFVLDGSPDALQWVWLGAEVAIALGCALALARLRLLGATIGTSRRS